MCSWVSCYQTMFSDNSLSEASLDVAFILPQSKKRKCRPGYKSPAKLARSKIRAKYFNLTQKIKQENQNLKEETSRIKSTIETYIERQHVLKKELKDKEEAINASKLTINLLEENKIKIEDKLNSYRGTLRKLIRENDNKKLEDKT